MEKRKIIDGKDITKGDVVLGLASSGIILTVSRCFESSELNLDAKSKPSNEEALRPNYVKSILAAIKEYQVNGISTTGGGLTNNIPRIMPKVVCKNKPRLLARPRNFHVVSGSGSYKGGRNASDL